MREIRREIKFRMWDAENGQMIDGDSLAFEEYAPISHLLSQEGIMQYTGLKDNNKKEAYHKDIVEFEGFLYSIEWDEKRTGFYLADLVYLDDPDSEEHKIGSCISESVIRGNQFEHPHLLEGRDEA